MEAERQEKIAMGLISSDEEADDDEDDSVDHSNLALIAHLAQPKKSITILESNSSSSSTGSSEMETPKKKKKRKKKLKDKVKQRVTVQFEKTRRKTMDVIDRKLLALSMFGRALPTAEAKWKKLRRNMSAPLLLGTYPQYAARPATPIDPKISLLSQLVYPAKAIEKKYGRLNSFNVQDAKVFFRRSKSFKQLIRKISEPDFHRMKQLSAKRIEELKRFDTNIFKSKRFTAPHPSRSHSVENASIRALSPATTLSSLSKYSSEKPVSFCKL